MTDNTEKFIAIVKAKYPQVKVLIPKYFKRIECWRHNHTSVVCSLEHVESDPVGMAERVAQELLSGSFNTHIVGLSKN